ncbi:MAG: hypothetical protein K9W46_04495 [Candidatus Heimdallarchaeum endolithica]|uniref:Uncharacterized protein n=1 Tax=Candidatus Heimdallarchaeum endolithica TaxID=2876572 RepID=A0A9Y1FQG6_9ARCH|nr:MAG: hypothetical protein K9W46_04495 [Candidatus Heimdallarchaeum endolithica]
MVKLKTYLDAIKKITKKIFKKNSNNENGIKNSWIIHKTNINSATMLFGVGDCGCNVLVTYLNHEAKLRSNYQIEFQKNSKVIGAWFINTSLEGAVHDAENSNRLENKYLVYAYNWWRQNVKTEPPTEDFPRRIRKQSDLLNKTRIKEEFLYNFVGISIDPTVVDRLGAGGFWYGGRKVAEDFFNPENYSETELFEQDISNRLWPPDLFRYSHGDETTDIQKKATIFFYIHGLGRGTGSGLTGKLITYLHDPFILKYDKNYNNKGKKFFESLKIIQHYKEASPQKAIAFSILGEGAYVDEVSCLIGLQRVLFCEIGHPLTLMNYFVTNKKIKETIIPFNYDILYPFQCEDNILFQINEAITKLVLAPIMNIGMFDVNDILEGRVANDYIKISSTDIFRRPNELDEKTYKDYGPLKGNYIIVPAVFYSKDMKNTNLLQWMDIALSKQTFADVIWIKFSDTKSKEVKKKIKEKFEFISQNYSKRLIIAPSTAEQKLAKQFYELLDDGNKNKQKLYQKYGLGLGNNYISESLTQNYSPNIKSNMVFIGIVNPFILEICWLFVKSLIKIYEEFKRLGSKIKGAEFFKEIKDVIDSVHNLPNCLKVEGNEFEECIDRLNHEFFGGFFNDLNATEKEFLQTFHNIYNTFKKSAPFEIWGFYFKDFCDKVDQGKDINELNIDYNNFREKVINYLTEEGLEVIA